MKKTHNKAFGNVLRELRHEMNYSQEFLGFEADLTRAYISLLERGLRSPTLDTIMMLCVSLNVSLVVFAGRIEQELGDFHD